MTVDVESMPTLLDALRELALDLSWCYQHATDEVWERLDPELWRLTNNAWLIVQSLSESKIEAAAGDSGFLEEVQDLLAARRRFASARAWFQRARPELALGTVAYFSMEFMLSEALPIYSGGLGNVSGDLLKTASDLGVPLVGVGLLFEQGYFRQEIDAQGRQRAVFPFNDPSTLPIRPLRSADGAPIRFTIPLGDTEIYTRAWSAQIGRTRLFLLDTNDPANPPIDRQITSELYGGDAELRLRQEIVLGIGGWRLLALAGIAADVCHLNEGHAALAVLERARAWMIQADTRFELALASTRAGNIFTTHTAVAAGFDRFDPHLVEKLLGPYAERDLQIEPARLLALGRVNPGDPREAFDMAYLAVRGAGAVNGVSRLHASVGREILQPLFPRWPQAEVPVTHVTNGVHMPTWDAAEPDRLWEATCGPERWRDAVGDTFDGFNRVSDEELWAMRNAARSTFVAAVEERVARQQLLDGASAGRGGRQTLKGAALTVGFARRFAAYKRPTLLLHDPDRFARILTNQNRPMQIVVAGKAHPADAEGSALIEQWTTFARRPDVRGRVAFLADYDMKLAEQMVGGVDLWLNTPSRGWEASGTSGMKVLVNGGLNLSELDGWWAEAYSPEVGWAIGDAGRGEASSDDEDARRLYDLLEGEVTSTFYTRDAGGVPRDWIRRVRQSLVRLTPAFSANRSLREYLDRLYVPASTAYRARTADGAQLGRELVAWKNALTNGWPAVRFGGLSVTRDHDAYAFRVEVELGAIDPDFLRVELYAESAPNAVRIPMARDERAGAGAFVYRAKVPVLRPATDYTPRIVPLHGSAYIPLEINLIRWYDGPR